jgi:hypothetical protein
MPRKKLPKRPLPSVFRRSLAVLKRVNEPLLVASKRSSFRWRWANMRSNAGVDSTPQSRFRIGLFVAANAGSELGLDEVSGRAVELLHVLSERLPVLHGLHERVNGCARNSEHEARQIGSC